MGTSIGQALFCFGLDVKNVNSGYDTMENEQSPCAVDHVEGEVTPSQSVSAHLAAGIRSIYHKGVDLTCTAETAFVTNPGPCERPECFHMSTVDGACFKVDSSADKLTQEEFWKYASLAKAAGRNETTSFVANRVFTDP